MAFRRRGPLRAYRIADGRKPIFDGSGAVLYGGRWSSPGRRVVYAAETYAGALIEKLVHTNIGRLPKHQKYIEILVPKDVAIEEIDPGEVVGWDAADLIASRSFGDQWYDSRRSAVLLVPSVVSRIERNVLINQEHRDFRKIRADEPKPVIWDERLFK